MVRKNFELRIHGSGTHKEIVKALTLLLNSIDDGIGDIEGTYEDGILCTEITEID